MQRVTKWGKNETNMRQHAQLNMYTNSLQKLFTNASSFARLSSHFDAHGTRKHKGSILYTYTNTVLTQLIHNLFTSPRPRGLVLSVGVGRNDGQGLHPMRQVAVGDLKSETQRNTELQKSADAKSLQNLRYVYNCLYVKI